MTDKTYTPVQLGELLHKTPQDIISMWMKKQFPHAFLDDKKTLRIPASDVQSLVNVSIPNVPKVDSSFVSTPVAPPVVEDVAAEELDEPVRTAEDIERTAQANAYERSVRLAADTYAQTRRKEADDYYDEKIKQADWFAKQTTEKADAYLRDRKSEAVDQSEQILQNADAAIRQKQETLRKLKVQFDRLYQATQANRSYSYQLAMTDSWGRFLAEVKRMIKLESA